MASTYSLLKQPNETLDLPPVQVHTFTRTASIISVP